MRFILFLFALISTSLLIDGCNSDCGSPPPVPAISYDGPVTEGDYLVLTARGDDNLTYEWKGPNGITGDRRILDIGVVQRINSGNYTVTVKDNEDCDGITNQTDIQIQAKELPCIPTVNQATFQNADVTSAIISQVTCSSSGGSNQDQFEMIAVADQVEITVTFPTEEPPLFKRSYGVKGNINYGAVDKVEVQAILGSDKKEYNARATGFVYIRIVSSNSFDVIFCDLPLEGENENITISGAINCEI